MVAKLNKGTAPTTQLTNANQKLNISITNRWNSANQYYDVTPGVPIQIAFDFEQGDMLNPYFFVRERIDGVWESGADRDRIASMSDGHYELELTPTGDHIRVYFEKATASDNGTLTTCYVDNLTITQDHLEIVQENNYYPFGLQHKGYNHGVSPLGNSTAQRWRFGGKEYQVELGLEWYDITARNYDPALGRWMNIDPLAEQMRRHSPYNYAFNSPIYFMDPDGRKPRGSQGPCGDKPCPDENRSNPTEEGFKEDFKGRMLESLTNFFKEGLDNLDNLLSFKSDKNSKSEDPKITRDGHIVYGEGGDSEAGNGIVSGMDRGNGSSISITGENINPFNTLLARAYSLPEGLTNVTSIDVNLTDNALIFHYSSNRSSYGKDDNVIRIKSSNNPKQDSAIEMRSTLRKELRGLTSYGTDSIQIFRKQDN